MKTFLLFWVIVSSVVLIFLLAIKADEIKNLEKEIAVKDSIINKMNEKWITPEYIGDTTIILDPEWKYLKIKIVSK